MTTDDIIQKVKGTLSFMKPNGGGITISGGDPLLQPDFVADIFKRVHEELGVTTCVDTSGLGHVEGWNKVLPHTDMVLFCIKSADPKTYFELTESTWGSTERFAKCVADHGVPMRIRHVLIPGITDTERELKGLIAFAKRQPTLDAIEVLPYHTLGVPKWKELNLEYRLKDARSPTQDEKEEFLAKLRNEGLRVLCE
eukprot:CAMPEP_0114509136 /NCGR_PEP_ID=MMETSP0109-20121206/13033_1 /TAXON_ID=29199 /ORGANISM="Chlorarachnion reptans, Strain CCCM449" /LENGTH=196 /DNA_ID=CAMNT_0001688237 /DNA_START=456 /DNA_END=1046 /DNA_ORIENTATION=-